MGKTAVLLLAFLAAAGVAASVATSSGASAAASPACSSTDLATWSPDGTQIAFVGRRLNHGSLPQRALCAADADGSQAVPLPNTLCLRLCRLDLIDSPSQLLWVKPNLLLYGDDYRIFAVPVGGEPQLIGRQFGSLEQFSVDAAADRLAAGAANCPQCSGPVTVLAMPSGALVGRVGGTKLDNVTPSIAPDGQKVVFARYHGDSAQGPSLWTASVDGSDLRRIVSRGEEPLWSPTGAAIAYLAYSAKPETWSQLDLVSPRGGKSRALLSGVLALYGWSPDGRRLALELAQGQRLAVVDVATGKVRTLLRLHFASTVAWSADSKELLVKTQPLRTSRCGTLWRVPVLGSKPQLLRLC